MLHDTPDIYWPQLTRKLAHKQVILTFDDGPSDPPPHGNTLPIAQFLHDQNIRATFFVVGQRIQQPGCHDTLAKLIDLGHIVANHTFTHPILPDLLKLDKSRLVPQLVDTHNLIRDLVAPGPFFFRPPYIAWNPEVCKILNSAPQLNDYHGPIMCDVFCHDWDLGKSVNGKLWTLQDCKDVFIQQLTAQQKGVLLLHDGSAAAALTPQQHNRDLQILELTQWLVQWLKNENYRFLPLDQLIPSRLQ